MSKIYTKTGDKGQTSLTGGKRVDKNDPLVAAYGTVDEANSMIGLALSKMKGESLEKVRDMLYDVQKDLFHVGAEISTPEDKEVYWKLNSNQVDNLEKYIDQLDSELPKLQQFILPGGSEVGSILHVARSIIRRAERIAIPTNKDLAIMYLNRCSDFLFVAARWVNFKLNQEELPFIPKH